MSIAGCSDEYKHKDKRFSITGTLVDYRCQPIVNTDIYALNIISSPGAYGCCGAGVNNITKTDDQGRFTIDLYQGEWVHIGTGKPMKLFKTGSILQSYNRTTLTNLREVADKGGHIVIYTQPKFDENYIFRHFAGWSQQPRVMRTAKDNLKDNGSKNLLGFITSQEGAVGLMGIDLDKLIDMRIRYVESEPKSVYQITIQGRENVGLIKAVHKEGQSRWDIPTDGYSSNKKYTFTVPAVSYPYELEDKWMHKTFFIKAIDGAKYAVVSLDIGLVSSFDLEHHDKFSTDESWMVAVWAMVDTIESKTYGHGNKNYRHRLPITSPIIPRRTCGGDFEGTHTGTLGHHPKIYQSFFYERKKHQDYILKELIGGS